MAYHEKIYTTAMLLELCRKNNSYFLDRLEFIRSTAKSIGLDDDTFVILKRLAVSSTQEKKVKNEEKKIVLLRQSDISPNKGGSLPVLSVFYLPEHKIFLLKTLGEKAKINNTSIEPDKVYPMNQDDVMSILGQLLSFNELFRLYYSFSSFRSLSIDATETTPLVDFNSKTNVLLMKGCSVPDNGFEFYSPIFTWLDNYLATNPEHITMNIQLDYFNTTSSKFIFEMLKRIKGYTGDKIPLSVNWFYSAGDEDIEEAGKIYSDVMNIPFALIAQEN
jgi:hypothetical protein